MTEADIEDDIRWNTVETDWANWDAPWESLPDLLTFDPDPVAGLLLGLRVTVFYFLGSGYNDSLFHRHCSEDWLIETHFEKWND